METERRLIQDTVNTFKRYLPYLRIACGFSQVSLADILEISTTTYIKIETGLEPMKIKDYFALRYIIEQDELGKSLLGVLVDSSYLTDKEKIGLVNRMDKAIKKVSRKEGMGVIKRDLIRTYNEFILEKKAGE